MDHTCHQCGREIEEGTPFCRNCGAPQIRIPGLDEPAAPAMPPGTPGEVQPPAEPVVLAHVPPPPPPAPAGVDWSQALPVAGWIGLWLAVLMLSFVVPFLGMLVFTFSLGVIGVMVYQRRVPDMPINASSGARIGAVCGLFAFAAMAVISALFFLLLRGSGLLRNAVQQALHQAAANNPDPNAQQMLAWMTSPAGMAVMVTISMVFMLFLFIGAASAGGAVGTTILQKKAKRTEL